MKRNHAILASLSCVLALSACTNTDTPSYRIAQNPQVYKDLPLREQELVSQGKIEEGMTPKAVFLAWGYPNTTPFQGMRNGKDITRWVYTKDEPVVTMNNWTGPSWGPLGWYDPLNTGYGYGSATTFVPKDVASVSFEGGKVISWEQENKRRFPE